MLRFELIVKLVDENLELCFEDFEKVVGVIFDEIVDVLVCGDWVELCGFGVFFVCY